MAVFEHLVSLQGQTCILKYGCLVVLQHYLSNCLCFGGKDVLNVYDMFYIGYAMVLRFRQVSGKVMIWAGFKGWILSI